MHSSRMRTTHSSTMMGGLCGRDPLTETSRQRPIGEIPPWTETPRQRLPGQRSLGQRRSGQRPPPSPQRRYLLATSFACGKYFTFCRLDEHNKFFPFRLFHLSCVIFIYHYPINRRVLNLMIPVVPAQKLDTMRLIILARTSSSPRSQASRY